MARFASSQTIPLWASAGVCIAAIAGWGALAARQQAADAGAARRSAVAAAQGRPSAPSVQRPSPPHSKPTIMSRAPGSDRPGDSAEPLAGANPLDPPVAAAQPRTDAAPVFDEAAPRGDANAPLDARVEDYTVRSGDTLVRIARQHRVTPELLAALNGLNRRGSIRAGQTLRVVRGPFSAVIDKSRFAMDVLLDGQLVQSFPVGLGRDGRTPRGTWRVFNKLVNPSWVDPGTSKRYAADDPANPVGEHWLGLEGLSGDAVGKLGYGIHGTIDPASIGRNESLGCVRLRPADVRRVYELLVEGGSTVEIR